MPAIWKVANTNTAVMQQISVFRMLIILLVVLVANVALTDAFSVSTIENTAKQQCQHQTQKQHWSRCVSSVLHSTTNNNSNQETCSRSSNSNSNNHLPNRRDALFLATAGAAFTLLSTAPSYAEAPFSTDGVRIVNEPNPFEENGSSASSSPMFKTESGLKYIELEEGTPTSTTLTAKTPQYGQLCVISYTGYLQLPGGGNPPQKFASQSGFVLKHGNGKLIAGLDEGLHTMKRGGKRRLIIPPKLGFVASGLGPLPELPWQRDRLNSLLERMVAERGGNLIYDVKLERFFDDEADQGYYQDDEISPEEFAELNRRLNGRGNNGKANNVLESVGESIELSDRERQKPIV